MRIFGGKFCLTVRVPNQPDIVAEDGQLNIRVRFPYFLPFRRD
jgi:hypothetical protein